MRNIQAKSFPIKNPPSVGKVFASLCIGQVQNGTNDSARHGLTDLHRILRLFEEGVCLGDLQSFRSQTVIGALEKFVVIKTGFIELPARFGRVSSTRKSLEAIRT
jgi:hypothetical protein